MTIRNSLRKWLDVPTIPKQSDYTKELEEATEKTIKEALNRLDRSFTQRIARFQVIHCVNDNKALIAGRDAVYTDFKGRKFCSHECIDKFATPGGEKGSTLSS